MNPRILLFLLPLLTACASRLPTRGENPPYRLITHLPETSKLLKKEIKRSKVSLEIDFDTGAFEGRYGRHAFAGKYQVEHRSAGFVKGFFYRVKLDSLDSPSTKKLHEKALFAQLATASRLYVAPDRLSDPTYILLEMRSGDSTLVFVKAK